MEFLLKIKLILLPNAKHFVKYITPAVWGGGASVGKVLRMLKQERGRAPNQNNVGI